MSHVALFFTAFLIAFLYAGYPVLATAARFFFGHQPLRGHRLGITPPRSGYHSSEADFELSNAAVR